MRIQILSDLHLEHGGDIPPLAPGAEIVVLAGDLAPAKHRAIRLAAEIWKDAAHILYVPGNHEFHGSDIEEARSLLALGCGLYGVTLLDTEAVTIGDVRFIGATLWTDFRLYSGPGTGTGGGSLPRTTIRGDWLARSRDTTAEAKAHRETGKRFGDFTGLIRDRESPDPGSPAGSRGQAGSGAGGLLTTAETARRHARDRAFIEAEIAAAREAGLEAVVITHHAPSPASIHHRYAGSPLNPAFVSDLDAMIVHLRPALWIHGHVHHAVSATVGRTHVIANPLGIGPTEEADFTPDLTVEL